MVEIVAAFGAGIWAAHSLDINVIFAAAAAGFFLVIAAVVRSGDCVGAKGTLFLLLWFIAGLLRLDCAVQPDREAISDYAGQSVAVHGKISGAPAISAGIGGEWRFRYTVELDRIGAENGETSSHTARNSIFLSVTQKTPWVQGVTGDEISAVGKVRLIHTYHNPGQPDWAEILAGRGIVARMSAIPETVRIVETETFFSRLARWRTRVRSELLKAMPEGDAALVIGMLFGGYEGIERQTVREFGATGIVHILSVSGAHIALVAAAIFWLARRLSLTPACSALLAAMAMTFYGFICGFSPPVIRSVFMGLLAMAAIGSERISYASHALSLALLAMLVREPRNLFDISFQLSAGCTAGLLYLYQPIRDGLRECMPDNIKDWVLIPMAATLAAELAVLPILSWYFGLFPLVSLLANLLVVPVLEGVILLGLLGVFICGGLPEAAHILFVGVSLLTGAAVEINRFLTGIPGGNLATPAWNFSWVCIYYLFLGWWAGFWNRWLPTYESVFRRRSGTVMTVMALTVACLFVYARYPDPLSVHFIDVGQGDATLIKTPHGRAILVDTGGMGGAGGGSFDVGERVVVPYLRHYGVKTLDLIILTHNHQDHAGGAAAVAELLGVHHVLANPEEQDSSALLRLQQAMRGKSIENPDDIEGFVIDGVKLSLFRAGDAQTGIPLPSEGSGNSSENARSTVVRVEYGLHSFLLTGDLEGKSEKKIITEGVPASTVLKVGHHGSKKSSQPEFLLHIAPQYAVISVGADNPFGHPAPGTVKRLTEWPIAVFRTDLNGAMVFRSDGHGLRLEKTLN